VDVSVSALYKTQKQQGAHWQGTGLQSSTAIEVSATATDFMCILFVCLWLDFRLLLTI